MSIPSSLLASETITFEGAIELTQSLLSLIEADQLLQRPTSSKLLDLW
jgi:hypothetical protein